MDVVSPIELSTGRFEQKNTKNEFLYLTAQIAESTISNLSAVSLTNLSSGIFYCSFKEVKNMVESQVPNWAGIEFPTRGRCYGSGS